VVALVLEGHLLVVLMEQVAMAVVQLQVRQIQPMLAQPTREVAVLVILMGQTIQPLATLVVKAAQVLSSFHTLPHNSLVVE
jgi:hypothetical protein